jgi:predicted transcriptional regulator of viral defense system
MVCQVVVDKPLRPITIGKIKIEFFYRKHIDLESITQKKSPASYFNVSSAELTAFDLVRYVSAAGGVNHAATVLYELSELINVSKLVEATQSCQIETVNIQRLGYLLSKVNADLDLAQLHDYLNNKNLRYRKLVSDRTNQVLNRNEYWHIDANVDIEMNEI